MFRRVHTESGDTHAEVVARRSTALNHAQQWFGRVFLIAFVPGACGKEVGTELRAELRPPATN
jgi:hypothetical protein